MNVSAEIVLIGHQQLEIMRLKMDNDRLAQQLDELKKATMPTAPIVHE